MNIELYYTIHHEVGTSEVYYDQRYNVSTWLPLGEYVLLPGQGHKVVFSHDSLDRVIAADAVKLASNDAESILYVHLDQLGELPDDR